MKNKFKSYGFWTALSGAVVMLLNSLGECFGFAIESELVSNLIMAFAGVLVVLGVVTMPKKGETGSEEQSQSDDELEETGSESKVSELDRVDNLDEQSQAKEAGEKESAKEEETSEADLKESKTAVKTKAKE